jgi:hypothetical protein
MDSADDPRLACSLFDRVDVPVEGRMAGVLAGDLVDVLDGAISDKLGVAAEVDEARSVVRVHDEQAHHRVGEHASLLPLPHHVDHRASVVDVDPHHTRLGQPSAPIVVSTPWIGFLGIEVRGGDRERLTADGGADVLPLFGLASTATTWAGRIRHRIGTSVSQSGLRPIVHLPRKEVDTDV